MRPGISRVVVEIVLLVLAVAFALLVFSSISGYIFGTMSKTSQVGGASTIQVLAVYNSSNILPGTNYVWIDVKNLGPNNITSPSGGRFSTDDFQVFIDGQHVRLYRIWEGTYDYVWSVGEVITIETTWRFDTSFATGQHKIEIYGPGNTQTMYLYSPS